MQGCTIDCNSTFAAGTGANATSNASWNAGYIVTGGANPADRANVTFSFLDAGNDNYHLKSDDTGAIDHGTSGVSGGFTTDIDNVARGATWDTGADEYAAGVSATVTGTATASITEGDVVAGSKTIIITLTGDTFIAA